MRKLMYPSLEFRVLYRQFLLRIVDLESLSGKADIEGFVGQFVGVLIMLSLIHAFIAVIYLLSSFAPADRLAFAWHAEQYLVATMMLVVGLFTVLTWDATFPDRRDVMVLAPLPIAYNSLREGGRIRHYPWHRRTRIEYRVRHCVAAGPGHRAWLDRWTAAMLRRLLDHDDRSRRLPLLYSVDRAGNDRASASAQSLSAAFRVLTA